MHIISLNIPNIFVVVVERDCVLSESGNKLLRVIYTHVGLQILIKYYQQSVLKIGLPLKLIQSV